MSIINKTYSTFLAIFPVIILFISVLTNSKYNFSYDDNYLSFNISYIIVFFWSLKRPEYLGYGFIFLAGILNDVIQNNPLGISSIEYLSLCIITGFARMTGSPIGIVANQPPTFDFTQHLPNAVGDKERDLQTLRRNQAVDHDVEHGTEGADA